jgi:hypothetical protein
MHLVSNDDRRVLIVVDRSGGRPAWDAGALGVSGQRTPYAVGQTVEVFDRAGDEVAARVRASSPPISGEAVVTVLAHWLAYRILFRGGWTVHIDAPDRDPIKIRCKDHAAAMATARELASMIEADGVQALDGLRYRSIGVVVSP